MRKLTTLLTIIFVIAIATTSFANLKISGNAKIRPRLDIKDNGIYGNKTSNGYYYYLACLNFNSDIGDGWFSHLQLGTNGNGYFSGMFADPTQPGASKPTNSVSIDGSTRGSVDFMLAYFGRKTDKFGYMGGIIPVDGIKNPMFDLHYYSNKMVDVPFYLFSNNGANGFTGYIGLNNGGKVNATLYVDNNDGVKTEDSSGVTTGDIVDQYSFMLDASFKLSDFSIQPAFLLTAVSQDLTDAPTTYGFNVSSPKVGQFKFSSSFFMSSQKEDSTDAYDAWFARAKTVGKLGKGTLVVWYDMAKKTFEQVGGDKVHDFSYLWVSYAIPVYKSDKGAVSIKPTWRYMTEKVDDAGVETKDFVRNKLEVAIDFSFK